MQSSHFDDILLATLYSSLPLQLQSLSISDSQIYNVANQHFLDDLLPLLPNLATLNIPHFLVKESTCFIPLLRLRHLTLTNLTMQHVDDLALHLTSLNLLTLTLKTRRQDYGPLHPIYIWAKEAKIDLIWK